MIFLGKSDIEKNGIFHYLLKVYVAKVKGTDTWWIFQKQALKFFEKKLS